MGIGENNENIGEAYHVSETLEGRLPLKQSSDRHETLRKRVSDDYRHFVFPRGFVLSEIFALKHMFFSRFC